MKSRQNSQPDSGFLIELSEPARRGLAGAGYTQLEQLTAISEAEIRQLHGVGPKAIGQLRSALAARGLSFAGERQTDKRAGADCGQSSS
jgi:hypothetical protein